MHEVVEHCHFLANRMLQQTGAEREGQPNVFKLQGLQFVPILYSRKVINSVYENPFIEINAFNEGLAQCDQIGQFIGLWDTF